ncbi:MAG: zinc ABC transporter substrate-binding protein [Candidatus Thiosymbion ectosymbiont of Robbea hypermnestra]|nr:zinc ABC transporter substrate-binding protein [Candidatus Thiosymbion ectosymbiont of Robbea hypermnestra]
MTSKANVQPLSRRVLARFLTACLVGILAAGSGLAPAREERPMRVMVSVPPQQTFVERIGGEHVAVRVMVGPGHDPHAYEPTPHQIAALSDADLYIRIGVPFEHAWMARIRSANRGMSVLDAHAGIGLHSSGGRRASPLATPSPAAHDHDHDHDHEHGHEHDRGRDGPAAAGVHRHKHHHPGAGDAHLWTDPRLVERMAARIRDRLSDLAPEKAPDFRRNYVAFAAELAALDREIRSLLEPLTNRRFMVFHPSWSHFAAAYGLTQVSIEKTGKEPGPRALATLIEQAQRAGIKAVFVQPQLSTKSAGQVARAIGGRVLILDPLAPDYADNLRRVAHKIAAALSE